MGCDIWQVQMIVRVSNIWKMPFATLFGGLLGMLAVLLSPNFVAPITAAWDASFPVLSPVQTEVIGRTGDEVFISIIARKHKGEECTLVRLYGYGIDKSGVHTLATVRRPDGAHHMGIVHDAGVHDFGVWRVKPTAEDAVRVEVYVEHNCLGRIIKSKMAEVDL